MERWIDCWRGRYIDYRRLVEKIGRYEYWCMFEYVDVVHLGLPVVGVIGFPMMCSFGAAFSRMCATGKGFTCHVGIIPYKYLSCMMMSRCFKAFIASSLKALCLLHFGS